MRASVCCVPWMLAESWIKGVVRALTCSLIYHTGRSSGCCTIPLCLSSCYFKDADRRSSPLVTHRGGAGPDESKEPELPWWQEASQLGFLETGVGNWDAVMWDAGVSGEAKRPQPNLPL